MQISELAKRTGVSARALRHYEERGLLHPERSSGGYRDYSESDIVRVARIKTMINAGLNTQVIREYFECARDGEHGTTMEMCPNLRSELEAISEHLSAEQAKIYETQQRLIDLVSLGS